MRYGKFHALERGNDLWSDWTEIGLEIADFEVGDGCCELQIQVGRRSGGFPCVTIDWGDGRIESQTTYLAKHEYAKAGRYFVRIGPEARWFRVWDCYAVSKDGRRRLVCRPRMRLYRWSDWLDSAEGSFCGWSDPTHGGLTGPVPRWGRSMTNTRCCYEACMDIEGGFPEWTDAITDATGTFQDSSLSGPVPRWGENVAKASFCYSNCNVRGRFPAWPSGCTECASCYRNARGLTGPLPPWPVGATSLDGTYEGCTGATGKIPAWPASVESVSRCYFGCTGLTGAWTEDPAELMPEAKLVYPPGSGNVRCFDAVTGASDALRSLFWDRNWGGTIPRPQ